MGIHIGAKEKSKEKDVNLNFIWSFDYTALRLAREPSEMPFESTDSKYFRTGLFELKCQPKLFIL